MTLALRTSARVVATAAAIGGLATLAITPAQAAEDDTTVQILGINDFHGRLLPNSFSGDAGAAVLGGAIDALEADYPDSVFAAAGDLIGASTFESFVQQDKPTIDAFNAMGLDVSAVGNHEFDQGYDDLVNRVMAPYDATSNPYGGAMWEYLGANVRDAAGDPALPETWTENFGDIEVGFVGAVTDHLHELVSPSGIEGLTIEEPYVAANRSAAQLKADGADLVVLLVHEGATSTAYDDAVDPNSDFGEIVTNVSDDVDAIISGHTHLAYDHRVPVKAWQDEGRAVTERPVVSAGQYGVNLNQLLFTLNANGDVVGLETSIIPLYNAYDPDADVAGIVQDAVDSAEPLGAAVIGKIDAPLYRASLAGGDPGSARGAESTLGNGVADVQLWATQESGAQIAFMNPGGLRADLLGKADGNRKTYPSDVTFKQAADVQPFANTLVTMTLTGEQISDVLEEQWQPEGSSRPFLRLGTSTGFTYTYDPAADAGERIGNMYLDGELIGADDTYTVTANSFLAAGGDNFSTLAEGTNVADSGRVDLQAMVDYLDDNGTLEVDPTQHAVGVTGMTDEPVAKGDTVSFDLSSLMMTGPGDTLDKNVKVTIGGKNRGKFAVTNEQQTDAYDEQGTAHVEFTVPKLPEGDTVIEVTGNKTGTVVRIPVTIGASPEPAQCTVDYTIHGTWPNGFISQVTITNDATIGVNGWDLAWDFTAGESIRNLWAGDDSQTGSSVHVKNLSWNPIIGAGDSVTFGFVGSGSGPAVPAAFSLNGNQCSVS
ncbi:5'-nucleotidase C-terminal domain-containing protein [Demequina aurantiaca]|uniref:5'-nucleotidase C-terminal domain-containing protein n=1 Tax=Demequina aurantiaca TaxID=676200 RepID=UPI000781F432|nr:5'-nucleotidase C-terminal domain-containing protein [Demequina aurantiaca]